MTFPHGKGVRGQHYFPAVQYPAIRSSVRHAIFSDLVLNHRAEFNQTYLMTFLHGKNVQEQRYFSMHPVSVTLSPPNTLGGT